MGPRVYVPIQEWLQIYVVNAIVQSRGSSGGSLVMKMCWTCLVPSPLERKGSHLLIFHHPRGQEQRKNDTGWRCLSYAPICSMNEMFINLSQKKQNQTNTEVHQLSNQLIKLADDVIFVFLHVLSLTSIWPPLLKKSLDPRNVHLTPARFAREQRFAQHHLCNNTATRPPILRCKTLAESDFSSGRDCLEDHPSSDMWFISMVYG